MRSLRGRHWHSRTEGISAFDQPHGIAETLLKIRAPGTSTRLPADIFSDAPALLERLTRALRDGELIGIFGDYDCDGITSTALWVRALKRRNAALAVRLPHRIHDGYGIQPRHVDWFLEQGISVLLVVDTGVTAHEAVARANEAGIDVLIVDHHHAPPSFPDALAIVHPKRATVETSPPSAATLSFALIEKLEGGDWKDRDTDLALAAIGTVADVMPLTGTNRALVVDALQAMQRLTHGPLFTLSKLSGIDGICTARDIAFGIAPRINAAGRMDDPTLALDALLEGGAALERLCLLNTERQLQVEEHLSALMETMECGDGTAGSPFLFSISREYPPGIVGLLAGKLTEQTGRPSLIGSVRGETVTASLRSPPSYSIVEALTRAAPLLLQYGGHAQAAGCSFRLSDADALQRVLIADVTAQLTADQLVPVSYYDLSLRSVRGLTQQAVQQLSELEPFGTGNPEPRMLLLGTTLDQVRTVGSDKSHLQARIDTLPAIGFRLGSLAEHTNQPLDVLCKLGLNTWNGRTTPQIVIEDMRIAS